MEAHWLWVGVGAVLGGYILVFGFLRNVNEWYYVVRLMKKQNPLPPGDMGWPLVGNFLAFTRAFRSAHPDSFINNLVSRYGRTGIYKTHLFGNPSVIVCMAEACRRVLTDYEQFRLGYPKATLRLVGSRSLSAEHKRLRRLTTAPIVGHSALALYMERIEEIMMKSLEEWASMKHPVEVLKEMKKVTFEVIIHIFMGSYNHSIVTKIGDLFTHVLNGIYASPINLPGFAFHKALKARRKLATIVQSVVDERRMMMIKSGEQERKTKKDLIEILLEVEDENGQKLEDEDIVDLLLVFLFAGHESSALAITWSIIYLTEHPQIMNKAKEEQEEIIKARPRSQKRLNLKEIKQMVYLAKVIDETLRRANISFSTFREANADVNINGYTIPKGWKVLIWARAVHMDPEYYPNPQEFNPSRWDDYNAKAGSFLPFGAGIRLCPGSDLAKLEISIFLHYFLLYYKMERVNPKCPNTCWPAPRPTDNCLAKVLKLVP